MKEEKTKSKKRLIYYLVLAVSVLLLIAATVLTVYFVTENNSVLHEDPPVIDPENPDDPKVPDDPTGPDNPSGGEKADFICPVSSTTYTMEYAEIFKNETLGWYYRHRAIDFVAEEGTAVHAIAAGTVTNMLVRHQTGNYIVIDHGNGVTAMYRFIEIDPSIKVGTKVTQGQQIGTVAAAYGIEKDEGTHLHLEMKKDNKVVNPLDYIDIVLDEK